MISYTSLYVSSSSWISTLPFVSARIESRSSDIELAQYSASSPFSSNSVFVARKYIDSVFSAVPVVALFCNTEFIAVPSATVFSNDVFEADRAAADRCKISEISCALTGSVFATWLIISTTRSASSATRLNPFNVEIKYSDACVAESMPSPTFANKLLTRASSSELGKL